MKHSIIQATAKPFEQVCSDLKNALANHGFGLLAVHDLSATLLHHNIDLAENCSIFEVCNPQQAAKVLDVDMSLSMVLPCRISVYTDAGKTRIGMIKLADTLLELSSISALVSVAQEVQSTMMDIIHEAAFSASTCSTS